MFLFLFDCTFICVKKYYLTFYVLYELSFCEKQIGKVRKNYFRIQYNIKELFINKKLTKICLSFNPL